MLPPDERGVAFPPVCARSRYQKRRVARTKNLPRHRHRFRPRLLRIKWGRMPTRTLNRRCIATARRPTRRVRWGTYPLNHGTAMRIRPAMGDPPSLSRHRHRYKQRSSTIVLGGRFQPGPTREAMKSVPSPPTSRRSHRRATIRRATCNPWCKEAIAPTHRPGGSRPHRSRRHAARIPANFPRNRRTCRHAGRTRASFPCSCLARAVHFRSRLRRMRRAAGNLTPHRCRVARMIAGAGSFRSHRVILRRKAGHMLCPRTEGQVAMR